MRKMDDAVARLMAMARAGAAGAAGGEQDRLGHLGEFGSNPGALGARTYVPEGLGRGAPLVVVMHGCTQTAAGYDHGSGWSTLADRHGFALLYPEQQRSNNANCCFNWFEREDTRRGAGEAESIRQMIERMIRDHGLDAGRVFVTGLSAGGAMASVMLATHPELFAGGAIIAGLAYGSASNIPEAFERMRGQGEAGGEALVDRVRRASRHDGAWPIISIWHGSSDATVAPSNATAILDQWRGLHGVGSKPDRVETVDGYPRRVWCDASGQAVIEDFSITGMGHGTPLSTSGEDACGAAGAYMLDVRISSTQQIARFWGLTENVVAEQPARAPAPAQQPTEAKLIVVPTATATATATAAARDRGPAVKPRPYQAPGAKTGPGRVIEDALRAAGLMR